MQNERHNPFCFQSELVLSHHFKKVPELAKLFHLARGPRITDPQRAVSLSQAT
jgi:hypothetical protein